MIFHTSQILKNIILTNFYGFANNQRNNYLFKKYIFLAENILCRNQRTFIKKIKIKMHELSKRHI
jgi:hypothetical protein